MRLVDLFHALVRPGLAVRIVREEIRVCEGDEALVGPLDLLQGRSRRDTEDFVVVQEGHPAWPPRFC